MMETFEKHQVSFVSVTQQFNTATSMGRLILNVLLSFAQFEREMISETEPGTRSPRPGAEANGSAECPFWAMTWSRPSWCSTRWSRTGAPDL